MSKTPNIKEFWKIVTARWFIAMSGPFGVPASAVGTYLTNGLPQIVFAVTCVFCIIFAAYSIWAIEREKLITAENKLWLIGSKLSLLYVNSKLNFDNQQRKTTVSLIFTNNGDDLLKAEVIETSFIINGIGITSPQSIKFNIHKAEQRECHYDVNGLPEINQDMPAEITVGFKAKYDTVEPNRERYCARNITYKFSTLHSTAQVTSNVNYEDDGYIV